MDFSSTCGPFGVSICYKGETKYRRFAEGCSVDTLSQMCASASRLAEVQFIRIDTFTCSKPFKCFTL